MSNRILALMATCARLVVSIGTLVILANAWPPQAFGFFATALAVATLLALLTNYGFVMNTLRELGANPGSAGQIISMSLAAKTCISLAVIVGATLYALAVSEWNSSEKHAFLIILFASLIGSFADLILNAFRAVDAFRTEVKIVVSTAVIHLAAILAGVFAGLSIEGISVVFLGTRIAYALVTFVALEKAVSFRKTCAFSRRDLSLFLRKSTPFALDASLINFSSQMDGIIVAHLLGLHAAGIYQAGFRISQGIIPFGAILASVHIPKFSALYEAGNHTASRYGWRMVGEFVILGLFFGLALSVIGPLYSTHLLGPEYSELSGLWTSIGVFTTVRFTASGLGAHLVVSSKSYARPVCVLFSTAVTAALYFTVLPVLGLEWSGWIGTAGAASLVFSYLLVMATPSRKPVQPKSVES